MQRRSLSAVMVIAVAGSLAAAPMPPAAAESARLKVIVHGAAETVTSPEWSDAACAKNTHEPNADGMTAQRFPTSPELNSFGAADFKLSRPCEVTLVTVRGIGAEDANRIVIWIYKNTSSDLPSPPGTSECSAIRMASGPNFVVPVSDCKLKRGRYWLAVQADTGHTWFWATTSDRQGLHDAWRNPGDGWATGCTVWDTVDTCAEFRWDYLFSIA